MTSSEAVETSRSRIEKWLSIMTQTIIKRSLLDKRTSLFKKIHFKCNCNSYNGSVGNNVITFVTKSFELQGIGYTGDLDR